MSWRREVSDLVGAPAATPAVFVTLGATGMWWREISADGSSLVPLTTADARRSGATRAAADGLPMRDASVAWAALSFLADGSTPAVRRAAVAELRRILAVGATLIVVDHNRPRRRGHALAAIVAPPRPRAPTPAAAWRRLGYPTARAVRDAGFAIDRLRLGAAERVQVITARR